MKPKEWVRFHGLDSISGWEHGQLVLNPNTCRRNPKSGTEHPAPTQPLLRACFLSSPATGYSTDRSLLDPVGATVGTGQHEC